MTLQSCVSLWSHVVRREMNIPVGSSGVPAKADDEVAGVVPVGSESSGALVVLEVGKVAVVVLDVANGLALVQLAELLLSRFRRNRRGDGRADKGEKSGRELHIIRKVAECAGLLSVVFLIVRACPAPVYICQPEMMLTAQLGGIQPVQPCKLSSNNKAPTFTQAIHKRGKLALSLGYGARLRIQAV